MSDLQPTCNKLQQLATDCISRQAAIEWCLEGLNNIPSVQPEIVRCKDCRHRDPEDKKCDCGHDILWQMPRDDEWFCADAERRTDDER